MLQDVVNLGCFLITALWALLLAWWPAWAALAAGLLLVAFGTAARRGRRGRAVTSGVAFVALAFIVPGARWLTWDDSFGALPAAWRPYTELLLVPAPLVALFIAVSVLQSLLPPPPTRAGHESMAANS